MKPTRKCEEIIIFGTGEMAEVAWYYFTYDSPYQVVAFANDRDHVKNKTFFGLPLISFDDVHRYYHPEKYKMFIAVGYSKLNKIRTLKYFQAKEKGYELVSYISSKATIWSEGERGVSSIGDNCFILENQVIQPFTSIGDNVILWSGNHIGHHSVIKDHCFLASHIVVSGRVVVEPYCFIGVNATIRDGITIGEKSIIGAGALIMHDVLPGSVYRPQATGVYKRRSVEVRL